MKTPRLTNYLALCLGLVMAVFLITSCADVQDLSTTGIEGFTVKKVSKEGMEGEIMVKIKNPNKMGFSIYPSEFDVSYGGVKLGKAKLKKRVHISGNSEKVYAFSLKSSFENINLMEVMSLFSNNKGGFVEINGDLKAGKLWLKKRYPVNIKERADLSTM